MADLQNWEILITFETESWWREIKIEKWTKQYEQIRQQFYDEFTNFDW